MKIPYEDLKLVNAKYSSELISASSKIIKGGWYVLGNSVKNFENNFGLEHNTSYCIGVASGLDALILGLEVYNFKPGKKVLVPSNSYIASILAIIRAGLVPVLVEPDLETYNINVSGLQKVYDSNCVAILPVHLYGRLCPMDEIMDFAKSNNLIVIEDCAQSHFAELNGIRAGNFGDIAAFSFYPTKNLGALGDAGAIICKDEIIYNKLLALRNYGSQQKYYNKYIGWNSRLDEIQAEFLNIKLKDYKSVILHKRELAQIYFDKLSKIKQLQMPSPAKENHVWHIFNILTSQRDLLRTYLSENDIGTEIHYPVPPHLQEGYFHLFTDEYPISEKLHKETLSLPISTCHTKKDINFVIEKITEFFQYTD